VAPAANLQVGESTTRRSGMPMLFERSKAVELRW
jgi:hypothetical protein